MHRGVRYPGPFAKTLSRDTSPSCAHPVKEALILNKPPADVVPWSRSLQKPANIMQTVCGVLLLTSLDWQGTGTYGRDRVSSNLSPAPLPPICPQLATLIICVILVKFLGGRKEGEGLLPSILSYLEGITS